MAARDDANATYDPAQRRTTPLSVKLTDRLRRAGPITVSAYVAACLHDPDDGYYVRQPAIGAAGDFVTAPEISQIFGELIGVWAAVVWQHMGAPEIFEIVELGPGRGTLMADIWRAIRKVPGLAGAARVRLIDTNPGLRDLQRSTLAGHGLQIDQYASLNDFEHRAEINDVGCSVVIANEFLDALGVRQLVARDGVWCERVVGLTEQGCLAFDVGPPVNLDADVGDVPSIRRDGDIFEINPALRNSIAPFLARFSGRNRALAALFIDYGHIDAARGDTLQAVRGHRYEHVLTSPGEADLSAHVDFGDCLRRLSQVGLAVHGPVTQAEFLGRMGIVERTSRLMSANPQRAGAIEAATLRLLAPNAMGTRFKVLGASKGLAGALPGLEERPP